MHTTTSRNFIFPAHIAIVLSMANHPQQIDERPPIDICPLLDTLPIELRLIVYENLLLSPEKIAISPGRRQQAVNQFRCQWCKTTHMIPPLPFWRPCVSILRTCKQINLEATAILYRHNKFLISCKCRGIHRIYEGETIFPVYPASDSPRSPSLQAFASHQVLHL